MLRWSSRPSAARVAAREIGRGRRLGSVLSIALAIALATGPAGSILAGEADAVALLARIASRDPIEARFVEQKHLQLLDAPIVSRGLLRYVPPDRLEKRTEQPRAETMILQDDRLILERDGRTRSIGVAQMPAVGALVGSLRDLLAGDRVALERRFRLIAQGSEASWQLVLLPSDPDLAGLVTRIVVRGNDASIASVEILQADGDRSTMQLTR